MSVNPVRAMFSDRRRGRHRSFSFQMRGTLVKQILTNGANQAHWCDHVIGRNYISRKVTYQKSRDWLVGYVLESELIRTDRKVKAEKANS